MSDPNLPDKRRQAAELRLAGVGYQQIADQLGYESVSGAYEAVQEGLRTEFASPTSELRDLELERLDAMLTGLWAKARRGDGPAVDRVLRIQERRAKYLGLDYGVAPSEDAGDPIDEIARRRRERRRGTA